MYRPGILNTIFNISIRYYVSNYLYIRNEFLHKIPGGITKITPGDTMKTHHPGAQLGPLWGRLKVVTTTDQP